MIVEGPDVLHLGLPAHLLNEDRECAWAEKHVRRDPDLSWILGNYVEADHANDNGHIFPFDELTAAQATLSHKPLNILHHARYTVGSFVASELVMPEVQLEEAAQAYGFPVLEALAVFWKHNFPDEGALIQKAHSEGSLYFSMETIPAEIECANETCGRRVRYQGRQHESYCSHVNATAGPKRLYKPHFNAGALIFPPARPGWRRAEINELSQLLQEHSDEAEKVYAGLQADLPHLEAQTWERMMESIMLQARDFSTQQREKMAKKKQAMPHGGFPIKNAQDLKNAIQAFGRAKDKAAAKAHIVRRAKALGLTKLLPQGWA